MINLCKLKTISLHDRKSKVSIRDFAKMYNLAKNNFSECFPNIFAAKDLRELVQHIKQAKQNNKKIIWMIGAHVIKNGLNPLIIQLMEQDYISHIALNGAGVIHDTEIALVGKTSEDVKENLNDGSFGMASETAGFINKSIDLRDMDGYGKAIGKTLFELTTYRDHSISAMAYEMGISVSVHIAIGTDINQMHPSFLPSVMAEASYRDFILFCKQISQLEDGVILNWGSAVILPEVFLKAFAINKNLGNQINNFVAANFDFVRQYRPDENILKRPGGKAYNFVGHHEIMLPLLAIMIMGDL